MEILGKKQNENGHNLSIFHAVSLIPMLVLPIFDYIFFCCSANSLQKSSSVIYNPCKFKFLL